MLVQLEGGVEFMRSPHKMVNVTQPRSAWRANFFSSVSMFDLSFCNQSSLFLADFSS